MGRPSPICVSIMNKGVVTPHLESFSKTLAEIFPLQELPSTQQALKPRSVLPASSHGGKNEGAGARAMSRHRDEGLRVWRQLCLSFSTCEVRDAGGLCT